VAVATGAIGLGDEPGDGPAGAASMLDLGLLALLAGAVLVRRGTRSVALPLVGAAFVVARFYAYDPYSLPALRRMSDGGLVPAAWVFALAGAAIASSLLQRLRPRAGGGLAALVLAACACTALLESAGH